MVRRVFTRKRECGHFLRPPIAPATLLRYHNASYACCSANLRIRCSSSALISSGTVPAVRARQGNKGDTVSSCEPVGQGRGVAAGMRTAPFRDDLRRQLLHRHVRVALATNQLCGRVRTWKGQEDVW